MESPAGLVGIRSVSIHASNDELLGSLWRIDSKQEGILQIAEDSCKHGTMMKFLQTRRFQCPWKNFFLCLRLACDTVDVFGFDLVLRSAPRVTISPKNLFYGGKS